MQNTKGGTTDMHDALIPQAPLTSSQCEALNLYREATGGSFDVYRLAGPRHARTRQDLMTLLTGTEARLPQSACGVNALRAAFYALHPPDGDCIAAREDDFSAWATEQTAPRPSRPFVGSLQRRHLAHDAAHASAGNDADECDVDSCPLLATVTP